MEAAALVVGYLAAFVLLAVLLYLPGLVLTRPFGLRVLRLPINLVRMALGMGTWMVLLFAASVLKALTLSVVASLAAAMALLAVPALKETMRPKEATRPRELSREPPGRLAGEQVLLLVVLAGVVVFLFLQALSPEVATDAQVYHLQVPKLMIESHGFRHVPFSVYSHWPMNVQLLFAMALMVKDHVLANLVHFLFGLLTLTSLVLFGREWRDTSAGLLAAAFFLANGVVLFEMPIAYVDVAGAFFLFLAFWCLEQALASPEAGRPHLLAAGVLCGLLAGSKLNGVIGCAAVGIVYLWVRGRGAGWRRAVAELSLWVALPATLLAAPWYVKSAIETGNPIYPLLYDRFGGIEWSPALAEQFAAWHRRIGMGREPLDYLLLPFRVALMGGPSYDRFAGTLSPAWVVLVPLSLVAAFRRPVVARSVGAGLVYLVLWSLSSQQARFLIPALPLFAAAASIAVLDLAAAVKHERGRRLAEAGLHVAAAVLLVASVGRVAAALRWRGPEPSREARARAVPPVFRYVNDRLPPDARLLLVDVNRGFFCDREYVADSFFEASQINEVLLKDRSTDEILATLRALGITHVLRWRHDRGIPYPRPFRRIFRDPALARPAFEDDRHLLYELVAAPPGVGSR